MFQEKLQIWGKKRYTNFKSYFNLAEGSKAKVLNYNKTQNATKPCSFLGKEIQDSKNVPQSDY